MNWRSLWLLDEAVTYLNHGSFGACPRAVLEAQSALRERMEREPVRFFASEFEGMLDRARRSLAEFVGARAEDIAFVPNATTAVNTILRALDLKPGDELLITDHEYNACRNATHVAAASAGARVVTAEIPFPLEGPDDVVEALLGRVSERTKVCLIDHVTSPTALVLPIERIVRELQEKRIVVLVDGAHGPGMLPLGVEAMGAEFYTGNCHKWLCAPKGAAFLWVREDWRRAVRPLVMSHGANSPRKDRSRFHLEFDWVGTMDLTPYLSVPEAIRYLGGLLPGGWPELMDRNRETALAARRRLCDRLGISLPCPDEMIGSIASFPMPDGESTAWDQIMDRDPIHRELFDRYQIEVPVFPWPHPPKRVLRISAQLYNTPQEYESLAEALAKVLAA